MHSSCMIFIRCKNPMQWEQKYDPFRQLHEEISTKNLPWSESSNNAFTWWITTFLELRKSNLNMMQWTSLSFLSKFWHWMDSGLELPDSTNLCTLSINEWWSARIPNYEAPVLSSNLSSILAIDRSLQFHVSYSLPAICGLTSSNALKEPRMCLRGWDDIAFCTCMQFLTNLQCILWRMYRDQWEWHGSKPIDKAKCWLPCNGIWIKVKLLKQTCRCPSIPADEWTIIVVKCFSS